MKIPQHILFFLSLFGSALAFAEAKSPLEYLKAMLAAHQTQQYEQLYFFQQGEERDTFRYRHAYINDQTYAQLVRLDFAREEVVQRDHIISYFGDFAPFSLESPRISDNLPSILTANFDRLEGYSVIDGGKSRVADRLVRLIRLVPNDHFRYRYRLWIDEEHFLLMRSELLDQEDNILEQFRVLQAVVDDEFSAIAEPISALALPPILPSAPSPTTSTPHKPMWRLNWLPTGFKPVSGTHRLYDKSLENELIAGQRYSDGLFSFSIYLLENRGIVFNEQFWREGKTSLYSQTVGDKDIVIVGEIPQVSARHILQEMRLNPPLAEEK